MDNNLMNFYAITEEGHEKVAIPIEILPNIYSEIKKYPDGLPITLGSGRVIYALALIIPTPALPKKRPMILFMDEV